MNRFVLFFDVLGFKEVRRSLGAAGLIKKYKEQLLLPLQSELEKLTGLACIDGVRSRLKSKIFSDSVIIYTENDEDIDLISIVWAAQALLRLGYSCCLPLRGAVSHGELLVDEENQIFVGKALEDAYVLSESQLWSGCTLHESIHEWLGSRNSGILRSLMFHDFLRINQLETDDPVVSCVCYDVPFKCKRSGLITREVTVVNWTRKEPFWLLTKSFNDPKSQRAKQIMRNTIEFETFCLSSP